MENAVTQRQMLSFWFVILQIQYIIPIVRDTKCSIKLSKVKSQKQHSFYVCPRYAEINFMNLSKEAIISHTELGK